MITRNVIMRNQKDVMEFVHIMEQYSYTVEVSLGGETMNAKSVLGMLALGFNKVMKMEIHAESADDLLDAAGRFICTQFGQAV